MPSATSTEMRTLHVAAMPFPTQQGTQALVHAMLNELAAAGHETHLLCYPHEGFERATAYTVHRSIDLAREHSERSGPSLRKIVQDGVLVRDVRRLCATLRPERVIAHHVEAAVAAQLARVSNVTFVAHTSLAAELSSYFPRAFGAACAHAGLALDRLASKGVARQLAISPLLQARLSHDTGRHFELLVPPWRPHAAIEPEERTKARARFDLAPTDEVVLYAGNLDAYQGLDVLCRGLERALTQRPRLRWLVGTDSDPAVLMRDLGCELRNRTRFVPLVADEVRRALHAASEIALVPRKTAGGLPIKLLDALAHGLPVVATHRATAGFEFGAACRLIPDDDAAQWSAALAAFFDLSAEHRRTFADAARETLLREHAAAACVRKLLA